MKTPITKAKLKTHFTYSTWKYLLLVVCAIFAWNLVYEMTKPQIPEELRIDIYIKSNTVTQEHLQAFFEPIWQETVPEMQLVEGTTMLNSSEQDPYGQMQLVTYIAAGQGDIYILPENDFKQIASSKGFLPLGPLVEQGKIDISDIDVQSGRVTVLEYDDKGNIIPPAEDENMELYGIPLNALYGYMDGLQLDNRNMYMAILYRNQNDENVIPFFNALLQAGRGEKMDWLKETEE